MATLITRVQALTGTVTNSEVADWMTDGAREIINLLPFELKQKCATTTELDNSTLTMDMDSSGKILFVTRLSADSDGYYLPCRLIPPMFGGLASDSTSLMYASSVNDPVFWIDANTSGSDGKSSTLYVKPNPTSAQKAYVHHVNYPTFAAGGTDTYDIEDKTIIANFPDEAEYLVVLYASIKVLQNKMNEKSSSLPTLSLPSIPVVPTLSDLSVDISSLTIPTYTSPVVSPDFEDANNWINTEEDNEMLNARVSAINSQLNEYNHNITNANNKHTKELETFKLQVEEKMKNVDMDNEVDKNKLTKYSLNIQDYQMQVSKESERFKNELQKYQLDYSWLQNQYAQLKDDYNKGISALVNQYIPNQKPKNEEKESK